MSRKVYKSVRGYLYILPLVFLFAAGILLRTTVKPSEPLPSVACSPMSLTGVFDPEGKIGYWEGKQKIIPSSYLALDTERVQVLGAANPSERWIEVDLSEQKLRAWDADKLYLETPVSSGLPKTPTPTGEFRVWMKIRATKMEGGQGRYYYNLPNVPYVMFFSNDKVAASLGYGLHGTYWHSDFGTVRSHGCVNLPTPIAKLLYEWATPELSEGQRVVRANENNPGTRIIIHE